MTGVFLWQNMENPIQPELSGDVLASERLAVFTIPGIFDDIVRRAGGRRPRCIRAKQNHVYKVFDASRGRGLAGMGRWVSARARTAAACAPASGEPDICVETTARVDARGAVAVTGLRRHGAGRRGSGLSYSSGGAGRSGCAPALVDALRKGKIQVAYQPLRVLDSGRMADVEAGALDA